MTKPIKPQSKEKQKKYAHAASNRAMLPREREK
jgi:hypothetical protein